MYKMSLATQPKRKNKKSNPIREIKLQQKRTDLLIPAAPFRRLVNEMTNDPDIRYQQEAVKALQTVSEAYLIDLFNVSNKIANYKGRETLHRSDISLAYNISK